MKRLLLSLICAFSLSAAGVSISTVTCTSQVVTVNCTGCGIAQYQGFSIAGTSVATYNLNSTAGTASANTFTFTLPAGTSCNGSASGGTVTRNLFVAAPWNVGYKVNIKKMDSSANQVIPSCQGGQLIDGVNATFPINIQYDSFTFQVNAAGNGFNLI